MKYIIILLYVISPVIHALDLNKYTEYSGEVDGYPTVLNERYYSNTKGELLIKSNNSLEHVYTLEEDAILIAEDNGTALGFINGKVGDETFFLCQTNLCQDGNERIWIEGHTVYKADTKPYSLSTGNRFSGHGVVVLISRLSDGNSNFKVSAIDLDGNILDSFSVIPRVSDTKYFGEAHTLTATTGITREKNFKLVTADHGRYVASLKQWNSNLNKFETLYFMHNKNGNGYLSGLLFDYPNGLAPIAISNPALDNRGERYSTIIFGVLDEGSHDNPNINSIIWGDAYIDDGSVVFRERLKQSSLPYEIKVDRLATSRANFLSGDRFSFLDIEIDLTKSNSAKLQENKLQDRDISDHILLRSDDGDVSIVELKEGYRLFSSNNTCY